VADAPIWPQRIRMERKARKWDVPATARRLRNTAGNDRHDLPGHADLVRSIRRWESGEVKAMSERYRLLYCAMFHLNENDLFSEKRNTSIPQPGAKTEHLAELGEIARAPQDDHQAGEDRSYTNSSNPQPAIDQREPGGRCSPPKECEEIGHTRDLQGLLVALHQLTTVIQQFDRVSDETDKEHAKDMNLARRELLFTIAGLGGAAVLPLKALETVRHTIDNTHGSPRIEDWDEIAWEYGCALKTRPVEKVIPDLALDVLELEKIYSATTSDRTAWARVTAQMTMLLARGLGFAGHARESRHWWIMARNAAERSGDSHLLALCLAWEGLQGLFERRPLPVLLTRAEQALQATKGTPCAGTVEALIVQAQARSLLGNDKGARESLQQQKRAFKQLPTRVVSDGSSVFGWPETRLLHTASWVATYGDHHDAAKVQQEALDAYPAGDVRAITQIRLHQAMSAVADGGSLDGLDLAKKAVTSLPEEHRTSFIRFNVVEVARAVPSTPETRAVVQILDSRRELMALTGLPREKGAV
jgi:hypothetical protein